jgi:serine/threonine-protein kinase
MSPEQLCGEALDRRADVYAAGVVLWEALCGRHAFSEGSPEEMLDQVIGGKTPPPSSVYAELAPFDPILRRALEGDPHARFSTAREMAIALEKCIEPATPSEVGGWVEATANEALRERTRMLEKVEGAGSRARARKAPRALAVVGLLLALSLGAATVVMSRVRARGASAPAVNTPSPGPEPMASQTAAPTEPLTGVPPSAETLPVLGSRRKPPSSPPARTRPECEMPYIVDAEGRRHYKRECMP